MDFDGAIRAHSNWMLRLFGYCKGTSREKLNPETIQKDNVCDLGQWLHGEGQKFAADPEFSGLLQAHAAFHEVLLPWCVWWTLDNAPMRNGF